MHPGYVSLSKLPRKKFNCIHFNLYSLQKNTKFVDRVEQKFTTNPKLGQDLKGRSVKKKTKKKTYNYLLIVFIVTLYCLQKKHKVCRSCGTKGHNKSETRSKS